jgi:hypothetical protein
MEKTSFRSNFHSQIQVTVYALLLSFLLFRAVFCQILITEIYRDPKGPESDLCAGASHEFVEITNLGSDTFTIDSLFISDGTESDQVINIGPLQVYAHQDCIYSSRFLPPGKTALIMDRDYEKAVAAYSCRLPVKSGTTLFTTPDTEIGNGLASDDGIFLYKGTRDSIVKIICIAADSLTKPASPVIGKITLTAGTPVPEGFSIVPVSFLFGKVEYGKCSDLLTPGEFEMLDSGWIVEYRCGEVNASFFPCTLALRYCGSNDFSNIKLTIKRSSGDIVEIVDEKELNLQDGKAFYNVRLPQKEGRWSVLISSSGRILTERVLDFSRIWLPDVSLKINEIFPKAQSEEPEWFELYNVSSSSVNISGWFFGNNEDSAVITHDNVIINQKEFYVVTKDADLFKRNHSGINNIVEPEVWHTLDNYNDTLCIWSVHKKLVDRICYSNSWFPNWVNQSIERIDVSCDGCERKAWELSQKSSPGQPNTVLYSRSRRSPLMEIGPVPFTPNKDGKDDRLLINLALPAGYSAVISIYGFDGRKMKTFSGPPAREYFWDGNSDNGSPAPVGPFFVVAELKSGNVKSMIRKKGLLWR